MKNLFSIQKIKQMQTPFLLNLSIIEKKKLYCNL